MLDVLELLFFLFVSSSSSSSSFLSLSRRIRILIPVHLNTYRPPYDLCGRKATLNAIGGRSGAV